MDIKVIIDSSLEGIKIKDALEQSAELQNFTRPMCIRWGNYIDEAEDRIVLNKAYAIKNTLDKENVILILRRNKIRAPRRLKPGKITDFPILGRKYTHKNGTDIRIIDSLDECKRCDCDYFQRYLKLTEEYRIHVMDLDVFYIEEKYHEAPEAEVDPIIRTKAFGWGVRETDLSNISEDKKEELFIVARKAIHSLGLDYGMVSIGKAINGRYYVIDVDATCRFMSEECLSAYIRQFIHTLQKYDGLINSDTDITIGADPECLLKDIETDELVCASDFFHFEGQCGLDQRSLEAGKRFFPLMELRPNYSTNPLKVYQSIEEILTGIYQNIHFKNIGIFSGSMPIYGYWLGGHIHFGIKPNSKFIRALNNYLALPFMMIEKSQTARQRKTTYGVLGNYRLKFHGGFEFCTLSSWLVTPEITRAILCLAKVIAQEYWNLNEEFICSYSDIRSYYLVNKNYYMDQISKVIQTVRNTATYPRYSKYIEPFFQMVQTAVEWPEDTNLKESWGLHSSDQRYQLPSRCYIPMKTRKEYGLKIGDKIKVRISESDYLLEVYPKDDLSSEKNGFISISHDICTKIEISEKDELGLFYDHKNNVYLIGPVFGIFAYSEPHYMGPFALQSYFFIKLMKLAKIKGMLAYVFTIWDIDWERKMVKGYSYDADSEKWIRKNFPLPHVIYDRGDVISEENYGEYATDYLKNITKLNIKLINSIECISTTNNKWTTYKLLNSCSRTSNYQPLTMEYDTPHSLLDFIDQFQHIFLKIKDGSRSKGIFSIRKNSENEYSIQYKNLYGYNIGLSSNRKDLTNLLDQKIKEMNCTRQDYIIQEGIPFAKYKEHNFEIRTVMQKNSKGIWLRTCMISRVTGSKERFLDVWNEEDIKASTILSEIFGEDNPAISNRIRTIAKAIVDLFEEHKIQAGEIAIDFGIDINRNIYIIELNSKPDNLLASIGAFRMRNLAINRILEYGRYLVVKDYNK